MFDFFRRYQKAMVAVLGVIAMLSFVVLPLVQQYYSQQGSTGSADSNQLVRFAGGELAPEQLQNFQYTHNRVLNFLAQVAQKVIERGGMPKVPGFIADSRGMVYRYGIDLVDDRNSEAHAIKTLLLAHEAKKMGFDLQDASIEQWIVDYTDGKVSQKEINEILRGVAEGRLGRNQLYSQLKTELLADLMTRLSNAGASGRGVYANNAAIVPPAAAWENYLKLNQSATVSTYALYVDDYLKEVPTDFPESKVVALYEKAKDKLKMNDSPEPGFRRRFAADLEYVYAPITDFVEKAKASVTEEQIKQEYDRRVTMGMYNVKETTPPASETPPAETPAKTEDKAEATPPAETKADAPEMKPEEKKPEEKPAATKTEEAQPKPEEKKPEEKNPEAEKKSEAKPADEAQEKPVEKTAEPKQEEPSSTEEPKSETPPQAMLRNGSGELFVKAQDQEKPEAEKKPDGDKPAETPAEEKPSDKPAEKPAEPPATDKPATSATTDKPQTEKLSGASDKVRPLEEVRDDIITFLAREPADQARSAALKKVMDEMTAYFAKHSAAEASIKSGKKVELPEAPDMAKFAEQNGLRYDHTGLIDVLGIQDRTIAQAMSGDFMAPGQSFLSLAFNPDAPEYLPQQVNNFFSGESFVFWKKDSRKGYIPSLEDARADVIAELRLEKARELTKAAAEKFKEEAAKSDKPLTELVPESRQTSIQQNVGPFTWMQQMGMQQRPMVSNLPKLDRVGNEFMKQVFSASTGEWAVGPNELESVYYVVKVESKTPDIESLRASFLKPTDRVATQPLADTMLSEIRDSWLVDLEEKLDLKLPERN